MDQGPSCRREKTDKDPGPARKGGLSRGSEADPHASTPSPPTAKLGPAEAPGKGLRGRRKPRTQDDRRPGEARPRPEGPHRFPGTQRQASLTRFPRPVPSHRTLLGSPGAHRALSKEPGPTADHSFPGGPTQVTASSFFQRHVLRPRTQPLIRQGLRGEMSTGGWGAGLPPQISSWGSEAPQCPGRATHASHIPGTCSTHQSQLLLQPPEGLPLPSAHKPLLQPLLKGPGEPGVAMLPASGGGRHCGG